jgi:hypothetical protein
MTTIAWQRHEKIAHATWQRIIVLIVLGYEAAGCLLGGALLVAAPDGRLMEMPVELMHGFFRDFMIPGIILIALGILTTAAFIAVLRKVSSDWFMALLALGGLLIWFWVEIAIIKELHWLHAMWGLPVVLGAVMAIPLIPHWRTALVRVALFCGILSSLLFISINIIVPLDYPGYNMLSQVPSELSAIGAPTKMLWSVLATPYTFLMIAFAWGVWKSAGENRYLRIAGASMLAYGALGFLWPFAPMHQREVLAAGGGTFEDTMHLALGGATQVFYLTALGFAAAALGKKFRIYSVITFVVLLFFGILTFLDAPKLALNEPTPMIGVWERTNIGIFLLWVIVLAIIQLKKEKNHKSTIGR